MSIEQDKRQVCERKGKLWKEINSSVLQGIGGSRLIISILAAASHCPKAV